MQHDRYLMGSKYDIFWDPFVQLNSKIFQDPFILYFKYLTEWKCEIYQDSSEQNEKYEQYEQDYIMNSVSLYNPHSLYTLCSL